jgi:glucan phosphoethanolaminetransferase (alkaline phosphatase superfamily)
MKKFNNPVVIGIGIGIAVSLVLYFLFNHTPYALAIGCIAGVYIARPASLLKGAAAGAIIAFPLGLFIGVTTWFATSTPTAPRAGPLAGLEDILLILAFGAVYGLVFVWLTKRMSRGQNIST